MFKHLQTKLMLLLAILLMGAGTAWADTITFDATTDVTTNVGNYSTTEASFSTSGGTWKAVGYGTVANTSLTIGKGNANYLQTPVVSGDITTVKVTCSSSYYLKVIDNDGNELAAQQKCPTSSSDLTFTIPSGHKQVKLFAKRQSATSNAAVVITKVVVTYDSGNTPSIAADDIVLADDSTNGSITYTINNEPTPAGTLTASIVNGGNIANLTIGTITSSSVPFTCDANTTTTARTSTITLTYTYGSESVTKDVTITQAAMPITYTTIQDLFNGATSTEADVKVTFNNWVVSGVSTNGKNVFVTDNTGKGFVMFFNSDQSSAFSAGQILSGNAVPCKLVLFGGYAEITNLDPNDLTKTAGGTVTAANVNMSELVGINTGALVGYETLTCNVNNNKYYLSDGTTTLQVYNSLFEFNSDANALDLEDGKIYNITGVYQQFYNTKEILPRSAADIVEVTITITPSTNNNSWGKVSLSGNVITAMPEDGYRVSSMTPYTLISGTATVVQNGNEFTVTASSDCTVQINFEAIPTHIITFSVNGNEETIDVEDGSSITFTTPTSNIPNGYMFTGWSATEVNPQSTAPTYVTSAISTSDITYYAVFAKGEDKEGWKKTEIDEVIGEGVYAIITASGYAFKGTINSSGHGETTTNAFSFDDNGIAEEAPSGTCEITFIASSDGYKMYNADKGYLYASKAGSGGLAWHASEDNYWSCVTTNNIPNWTYSKSYSGSYARLRDYSDNSFRTYGANNGSVIHFAHKTNISSKSDFRTSVKETVSVTSAGYATYVSDNDLDYTNVSGLEAFSAQVSGDKVSFTKVQKVKAGEGVLLKAKDGGSFNVPVTSGVAANDNNAFIRGNDETVASAVDNNTKFNYILNKVNNVVAFYAANGQMVAKNRAYLQTTTQNARINLGFDDENTTGIDNANVNDNLNGSCFDLQGRRVAQPQKGLYIVNGKKVIIK